MNMFSKAKQFARELAELRALQARYGINLSVLEMARLGWVETFRRVIRHFDPADYPRVLAAESPTLERALRILKRLPLQTPVTEARVRTLFREEHIPQEYYDDLLTCVFNEPDASDK